MAANHRGGASRTGGQKDRKASQSKTPIGAKTNNEWLNPRCMVKFSTGPP